MKGLAHRRFSMKGRKETGTSSERNRKNGAMNCKKWSSKSKDFNTHQARKSKVSCHSTLSKQGYLTTGIHSEGPSPQLLWLVTDRHTIRIANYIKTSTREQPINRYCGKNSVDKDLFNTDTYFQKTQCKGWGEMIIYTLLAIKAYSLKKRDSLTITSSCNKKCRTTPTYCKPAAIETNPKVNLC
jgi:hypothetical protein